MHNRELSTAQLHNTRILHGWIPSSIQISIDPGEFIVIAFPRNRVWDENLYNNGNGNQYQSIFPLTHHVTQFLNRKSLTLYNCFTFPVATLDTTNMECETVGEKGDNTRGKCTARQTF